MKRPPLLLLFLGFVCDIHAADTSRSDVTAALRDWIGESPGGVAGAWIDADNTVFHEAGRFSAADPRPVTADTQFEVGSITKVFTALLLAEAAQEKRLALNAPVGAPFATNTVTHEQLATHTSGLPRLPDGFASNEPADPYKGYTLTNLTKAFDLAAPATRPSAAPAYSNFGFAALGHAVAGAWGEAYAPLLERRVLAPLGLTDTVTDWRQADRTRLAPGHDGARPTANWDMAAFAPTGALVSTTRDLAKFVRSCLATDPALPLHAALAETLRPRVPDENGSGRIGLAWQIARQGAAIVYWHNGGTGGSRSFLAFSPETGRGIVLLTNHTRGLEALGFALLAGKLPDPAPTAAPTAAGLRPYLGDYPLTPAFVIAITATGKDLFLQATGQPRLRLKPLHPDHYAIEGVEAEIAFERDPAGNVIALVLHQNGLRQRAPRAPKPAR